MSLPPLGAPLAPQMSPDGVMRLVPCQGHGAAAPVSRTPGHIVLPNASPDEQGLVWLFPQLVGVQSDLTSLRRHLRATWEWAFGSAMHRAIITHFAPEVPAEQATARAMEQLRPLLAVTPPGRDVGQIAALLDQRVDLFGPSSEAQFLAWRWGLHAEYAIGHSGSGAGAVVSTEAIRYRSWDDMRLLTENELAARVNSLMSVYMQAPYDIAALWRGLPTAAERQVQADRKARNEAFVSGAAALYRSVQEHQDRKAYRRAANAVARSENALGEYRLARAARTRRRGGFFF